MFNGNTPTKLSYVIGMKYGVIYSKINDEELTEVKMAAHELKRICETRYCVFYIDSISDIKFLPTSKKSGSGDLALSAPCSIGSVVRDMNGKQYTLTGDDKWVTFDTSSGIGEIEIATDREVNNMLDDIFV